MSRAGYLVVTLLFVLVIVGGGVAGYLSVDHPVVGATAEVPAVPKEKEAAVATRLTLHEIDYVRKLLPSEQ